MGVRQFNGFKFAGRTSGTGIGARTLLAPGVFALSLPGLLYAHPGLHHDIERVTKALAEAPDRADLLTERAYYYRLDGKPDSAWADLELAVALAPADREVALQRGLTLSALGKDADALAELDRFLRLGPPSAKAYAERARILVRRGEPEEAVKAYSTALALDKDVELFADRGRLQESLGRLDDAAAGYREGMASLGGAVVLRLALIRVEIQRHGFEEALRLIDEVLQQSQVKTEWLLERGAVLDQAGRTDEALAARKAALVEAERVVSFRPTALNLLARAKAEVALGEIGAAERDLSALLKKSPRLAEAQTLLESLQSQKGLAVVPK